MGNLMNNSSAHMSGGCKLCGKNVIHLDGCCDVYKLNDIRDSNYNSQANYAMDCRGKQRQVLFDRVQDCAQLFCAGLCATISFTSVSPDNMFDGLDDVDDNVLVDVGTPVIAANPATAPEHSEWDANTFDTNAVFNELGITFVNGVQVVPSYDKKADTPHFADETPEDVEDDDNDDGNFYASELPVPSMEGYPFRQPALDTVFREMFKNLQMRCSDMRAPVNLAFVEWKLLIMRDY
jgi:hypothetical protein